MHTPTDTMESRGSMIKRLNNGILNALKRIKFRAVGAVLLGGCAGLSLTTSVIPTAMEALGHGDSFATRWELAGYAVYSMMVWAVGGWAAQRTGSGKAGAIILGFVGLASGTLLTATALGTELPLLLAGGGAGMFYGIIGGMLIGSSLRTPPAD